MSIDIIKKANELKESLIHKELDSPIYDKIIAVIEKNIKQLEK